MVHFLGLNKEEENKGTHIYTTQFLDIYIKKKLFYSESLHLQKMPF